MNMQCSLIMEVMLYEFELGYNASKATKNICCAKDEGAVNHNTVNKWYKKLRSDCKNLDDQARLGRPKSIDSEVLSH